MKYMVKFWKDKLKVVEEKNFVKSVSFVGIISFGCVV